MRQRCADSESATSRCEDEIIAGDLDIKLRRTINLDFEVELSEETNLHLLSSKLTGDALNALFEKLG